MARITKSEIAHAFKRFCEVHGLRQSNGLGGAANVGAYRLDYNACYGGWVIEMICNDMGGVTRPFTDYRQSNQAFWAMLWFAIRVKENV